MKKLAVLLCAASALLVACDMDKSSGSSGNNLVGEPLPRAVTLYHTSGYNVECTQNTLASIPSNYSAKYIVSSKTFTTSLASYETCKDISVDDYLADTSSRYEYRDDYYAYTKYTYEYGGTYISQEDTRIRSRQQGNSVTHAYAMENGRKQRQWTFEKTPDSDGNIQQFTYTTYDNNGRRLNHIKSGTPRTRYGSNNGEELIILFTVERNGWSKEADYLIINKLILLPEELDTGEYVLRTYLDNSGAPTGGRLERNGNVEICYEERFNHMYAYQTQGVGACDGQPLAVVSY